MLRRFTAALLIALGSCTSTPAPRPVPAPVALPPAVPRPAPALGEDWRDWPLTPGTWSYGLEPGGSVASFGRAGVEPELILRCERGAGRVRMLLRRNAPSAITVRTSSTLRTLATVIAQAAPLQIVADLSAADSLLDAMGFSRGRFIVEQAGYPPLVVPAWAEVLRVTEDCRG